MKEMIYNLFAGKDLEIAQLILKRRRQLLYHSCLYYVFGESIVSDHKWAEWALELRDLQKVYPDIAELVELHGYFRDWDGSTGYHLPIRNKWVMNKAKDILDKWNDRWSEREVDRELVYRRLSEIKKINTKEEYDEVKDLLDQADQVYYMF